MAIRKLDAAHTKRKAACSAEVGRSRDHSHVQRRTAPETRKQLHSLGGRCVIHDKKVIWTPRLPLQCTQEPLQKSRPVIGNDDGGDDHAWARNMFSAAFNEAPTTWSML